MEKKDHLIKSMSNLYHNIIYYNILYINLPYLHLFRGNLKLKQGRDFLLEPSQIRGMVFLMAFNRAFKLVWHPQNP